MKHALLAAAAVAALLAPTLSHAQAATVVHPLVGAALTGGGDEITEVRYTDGSTRKIRAGNLLDIYGGVDVRLGGAPIDILATVGYHVDSAGGWNGSLRFERYPIEALVLFHPAPAVRFGVGPRYSAGASVKTSGVVDNVGNPHFKSQLGGVVMGEWLFTPHQGVQVRYVHETFKLDGMRVDGSHGGVGYTYYF